MDNIIRIDFIQQSQLVQASVKHVLGELERSPTTDKKFHILTQKLDATLKILLNFKEQPSIALFTQITTDTLEKEIISLYGRVTNEWIKNKVNRIQNKAAQLENSLCCGTVTAKAVQKLALHVRSFKKDHLPCIEDRRLIAQAELTLCRAHAFLQGKTEIKNNCCDQKKIWDEEFDHAAPEEVEALMAIAYCIHRCDMPNAKRLYNQLPEELKRRFLEHMLLLGATPFIDSFENQQAFIAMANERVRNGEGYPSRAQIDELFLGLSQVNVEEKKDPDKIFSLRSRASLGG